MEYFRREKGVTIIKDAFNVFTLSFYLRISPIKLKHDSNQVEPPYEAKLEFFRRQSHALVLKKLFDVFTLSTMSYRSMQRSPQSLPSSDILVGGADLPMTFGLRRLPQRPPVLSRSSSTSSPMGGIGMLSSLDLQYDSQLRFDC